MNSKSLLFLAGKRTPFGANGGSLRDAHPTDLMVTCSRAALEQSRLSAEEIDHVIVGNVIHSAADSIYSPRHTGLKLGIPVEVPALGINRLCGSGFQVVIDAYHQFLAGDAEVVLVGGVENMSMSPYVLRSVRWGVKMGNTSAQDMLMDSLFDTFAGFPMAMTAENLGAQFGLSREETDQFALRSQQKYAKALLEGKFENEIAPYEIQDKKGTTITLTQDEHPRGETTLEKLAKLKPLFPQLKEKALVHAGNASGIVDGAAALIVATEGKVKSKNLKPIGRLVSYGISGCDPKIMGFGPVPATQIALKRAGMKLSQMDLVEINEAFAAQTLAVQKALEIDPEILNVNGGAIAVGHPLAASGTRIIQTLLYELARRKKKFGLGSACIGGGQGIALIVESFL